MTLDKTNGRAHERLTRLRHNKNVLSQHSDLGNSRLQYRNTSGNAFEEKGSTSANCATVGWPSGKKFRSIVRRRRSHRAVARKSHGQDPVSWAWRQSPCRAALFNKDKIWQHPRTPQTRCKCTLFKIKMKQSAKRQRQLARNFKFVGCFFFLVSQPCAAKWRYLDCLHPAQATGGTEWRMFSTFPFGVRSHRMRKHICT